MPEAFAALIESHGSLDQHLEDASRQRKALAVSLSALLPTNVDDEWFDRERFLAAYGRCAPPNSPSAAAFFTTIDNEYNEFAPVLKLSGPAKSLAQWLMSEPQPAESIG